MTPAAMGCYKPERVRALGGHALVVGGSLAGLLTARVLADGFESVTVLERDQLGNETVPRRGVPHGRHSHVLLEAGRATLEDLLPG